MKVRMVSYAKVFPLAAYVNEKIGVEIELDDTDDEDNAFGLAKELVNGWGSKAESGGNLLAQSMGGYNPLEEPFFTQPIPTKDISKERDVLTEEMLIADMDACKTRSELETFRLQAKIWDSTEKHYLNKLKEFV